MKQIGVEIRIPAPRDAAPEENGPVDLRRRLASAASTSELRRRLAVDHDAEARSRLSKRGEHLLADPHLDDGPAVGPGGGDGG